MQEVALAGAVRADDRDALAEPQLGVERIGESVELELFEHHRALARPRAAEPHRDLLVANPFRRGTGLVEMTQPAFGRLGLGREVVGERGAALHLLHDRFEAIALTHVAGVLVLDALSSRVPRFVVGGERCAVRPRAARFESHDFRGGRGEELAVVADVQDRLVRRPQLIFEPSLGGDVEEVVGLVEQQHVIGAAQEHLQREPLLLTARERRDRPIADLREIHAERLGEAGVPEHLGVVSARVAPAAQRLRVLQRSIRVARALRDDALGIGELGGGLAERGCGKRDEERPHGRVVADRADELAHDPGPSVDAHGSFGGALVAGEHSHARSSSRRRSRRRARPAHRCRHGTRRRGTADVRCPGASTPSPAPRWRPRGGNATRSVAAARRFG